MSDVVKSIVGGVILGAVAFFTGGAGIGLLGTSSFLGSVAAGAVLGGVTGVLSLIARPKLPELSSDFGREMQLNGDPAAPRKICYGEAWTAGTLRFHGAVGENNKDLYLVIVLAGHEIDSVQAAEFDGETLTLDGNGNVTSPAKWDGLMNVRYHLGTDDQTVDTVLDSAFATWTSNHRLRGLAYAVVKLTFDEEDLASIPNMRFKIRGRKVYDPRKDSTNGGSGSHRLDDESTWEWTQNAVLCACDFLRGPKVNGRAIAGLRVADTRIDWANVIAEANVCDEEVELADESTQVRYTVDGFIDPRQEHRQNLRHFEAAMAGDISFADGKWRFFAGAFRTPTLHLQDQHFIGPLTHIVHKGEAQRVDTAQGIFASAANSGDVMDYPPVRLDSATTGSERIHRLDFQLVSDSARAQRCAKLLLEREAAGKRITCTTTLYGYRAVPGETINITHAAFGLSTQAMRVLDVELAAVQVSEGKMGLVTNLVLEAGPASLYSWDAEETELAAAPVIPRAEVPFPAFTSSFLASIYRRSSTQPATPTGGSYNFGTKTLTPPSGWSATPPDSDGNPLYVSVAIFEVLGVSGTDTSATWTAPALLVSDGVDGSAGDDGITSIVVQIFRRAATQPATPTGGSYNFGTSTLTPPSNWTAAIPTSDGNPVWVSHGLFEIQGTSGTDSTVTWTAPAMLTEGNTVLIGNGLINPGFETGTLSGWTHVAGTATVDVLTTNPRFGTYHLRVAPGIGEFVRVRNDSRLQVSEGDRVLAQGFVRGVGGGTKNTHVQIVFRDSSGGVLASPDGNINTTNSYALSRVIAVAPENAVVADFEFVVRDTDTSGAGMYVDGAYMAIIPRGADIILDDATGTVSTRQIGEEAVNELVNISVAPATVPGSPISSSPGFFSELAALAEATWENNTGETVDVRIEYSGMFATESTSTGAFYSVWGEYDTGGSDIRDGLGKFVIRSIEPEYTAKSGSFVASVPDAATLRARIAWGVSAPSGSAAATDFYHDGLNITVQAVKR